MTRNCAAAYIERNVSSKSRKKGYMCQGKRKRRDERVVWSVCEDALRKEEEGRKKKRR